MHVSYEKNKSDFKTNMMRKSNKKLEVPEDGVREKYFSHSIFKTLSDIKDFYKCLSDIDDTSTILVVKDEINIYWDIFDSISNTIDSIILLLEKGRVNDSLALMRKFNDAVITSVYILVMIKKGEKDFLDLNIEYTNIYDNILNQWVKGEECLIEKKMIEKKDDEYKMNIYLTKIRECNDVLDRLLFTRKNQKLYGHARSSFNDNVHYNNWESFRWNNDIFLDHESCLSVLSQAEKAIKLFLTIQFAYTTVLHPMALKTDDIGSCAAAPFAEEIFNNYIVPENGDLASYLKHSSFLTFEE